MESTIGQLKEVNRALVQDIDAIMRVSSEDVVIKCPNCGTDWNMTMYYGCDHCDRIGGRELFEALEEIDETQILDALADKYPDKFKEIVRRKLTETNAYERAEGVESSSEINDLEMSK